MVDSLLGQGKEGVNKTGKSIDWSKMDVKERIFHSEVSIAVDKFRRVVSWNLLMGIEEKIGNNPVGVPELAVFDDVESGELAPLPDPITKSSDDWNDPDMDEEDRIRAIDAGYFEAPAPPTPVANEPHLVRVRIIQSSEDPIIDEDGQEISIIKGEFCECSRKMSETLISIGLAEHVDA